MGHLRLQATTLSGQMLGSTDPPSAPSISSSGESDDAAGSENERALLDAAATSLSEAANEAFEELRAWAAGRVGPAHSQAEPPVAELASICKPNGAWTNERVVVFTECVDT